MTPNQPTFRRKREKENCETIFVGYGSLQGAACNFSCTRCFESAVDAIG